MVMEVLHEEDVVHCADHPHLNSTPGGICALCLQEKLGKLVSSSFPAAIFPSSSPSFRSDAGINSPDRSGPSKAPLQDPHPISSTTKSGSRKKEFDRYSRIMRSPFVSSLKKKNKETLGFGDSDSPNNSLKRSMSSANPRRSAHFLDESPNTRGFWSFLHSKNASSSKKSSSNLKDTIGSSSVSGVGGTIRSNEKQSGGSLTIATNESSDEDSSDRKVSRSRSLGCGSGGFSVGFLEKLSTGFGDCNLRRVESQKEGKNTLNIEPGRREKLRLDGNSSANSSSPSSSHWGASSVHDSSSVGRKSVSVHSRSKSWAWVFSSPMRAFSNSPVRKKKESSSSKRLTPNLSAIPSLLTMS